MQRVFVVDNQELVRRGVAALVDAEPGLRFVGDAATGRDAIVGIAATRPDVVVLETHLPDISGIELCRVIRTAVPATACVILTLLDDDLAMADSAVAGAAAYLLKDVSGRRLVESIHRVASGEMLIDPGLRRGGVGRQRRGASAAALGARERQILDLIADGMTNRQIAERLVLAEKTVKNNVSGLFTKLGMERRTQAAVYGAGLRRG